MNKELFTLGKKSGTMSSVLALSFVAAMAIWGATFVQSETQEIENQVAAVAESAGIQLY